MLKNLKVLPVHLPFLRTAGGALLAFFLVSRLASADTTLFNDGFESGDGITTGTLNGQNNWKTDPSYSISPIVTTGPVGSVDPSQVVEGGAGTSVAYNSNLFAAGSLSTSSTVTLTFDLEATASGQADLFGIGNVPSTYSGLGESIGPAFGLVPGGNFGFYSGGTGGNVAAYTAGGANFAPVLNDWYAVQSVWNLSTNTATLAYKNLTTGDTSFTTLYFNNTGTQTTTTLESGVTDSVSAWNTAYLRLPNNASADYLDNISAVVSVPEPSTYALLLGGLVLLASAARRHRFAGMLRA